MTATYLQSLGFISTTPSVRANQASFDKSWRYQYDHTAADGTALYLEHPLGIAACWLSTQEFPLATTDLLARLALDDRLGLEQAMNTFFAAHGGLGPRLPVRNNPFRPARYQP